MDVREMDVFEANLELYCTSDEISATYYVSESSIFKEVTALVMKYKPVDSDESK